MTNAILKLLPLRRWYATVSYFFKVLKSNAPKLLTDTNYIKQSYKIRNTRSIPQFRLKQKKQSFF